MFWITLTMGIVIGLAIGTTIYALVIENIAPLNHAKNSKWT